MALVALVWLPALLGVFAVAGGGLTTPAGEATTGGLLDVLKALDPTTGREVLPSLAATLDRAEATADGADRAEVQTLRQTVEGALAAALPVDTRQAREELNEAAERYEAIRRTEPAGDARTFRLERLLARMRAVAKQARFTVAELDERFAGFDAPPAGQRIVGLALLQALPSGDRYLDVAVQAITGCLSAFEQYHALRAAQGMLPALDAEHRRRLAAAIQSQREEGGHIRPGTDAGR
jgi:hypothetical protein